MFDEAGEDDLLLAAMAELGARGGAIGGRAAGGFTGLPGGKAAARGGARGAVRGYRWTKKDVQTASLPFAGSPTTAFERIAAAFAQSGGLVGTEAGEDGSFAVRAMVRVGIGNLNPTVVTARVSAGSDGTTTVDLRAAGREGLIKQHPAAKALTRVTAMLTSAG